MKRPQTRDEFLMGYFLHEFIGLKRRTESLDGVESIGAAWRLQREDLVKIN